MVTKSVKRNVSAYLAGVSSLPDAVGAIAAAGDVRRVRYIDGNPENNFMFNLWTNNGTAALGCLVTRRTADRAFDLALVLYERAKRESPRDPGEVQGWCRGKLCTTHHYMGGIRRRQQELKEEYPTLFE